MDPQLECFACFDSFSSGRMYVYRLSYLDVKYASLFWMGKHGSSCLKAARFSEYRIKHTITRMDVKQNTLNVNDVGYLRIKKHGGAQVHLTPGKKKQGLRVRADIDRTSSNSSFLINIDDSSHSPLHTLKSILLPYHHSLCQSPDRSFP